MPQCAARGQHAEPGDDVILVAEVFDPGHRSAVPCADVGHGVGAIGEAVDLQFGQFRAGQGLEVAQIDRLLIWIDEFRRRVGGASSNTAPPLHLSFHLRDRTLPGGFPAGSDLPAGGARLP